MRNHFDGSHIAFQDFLRLHLTYRRQAYARYLQEGSRLARPSATLEAAGVDARMPLRNPDIRRHLVSRY